MTASHLSAGARFSGRSYAGSVRRPLSGLRIGRSLHRSDQWVRARGSLNECGSPRSPCPIVCRALLQTSPPRRLASDVDETAVVALEGDGHGCSRAVTVFGYHKIGLARSRALAIVSVFAMQQNNDICRLCYGVGLA
jgi:hypothetical protein